MCGNLFRFLRHSVHTHVSLRGSMGGGAKVSGSIDLSNLGSDCYNHPTHHHPHPTTTVYNITPPTRLFSASKLLSHLLHLCWGSLFVSQWKSLTSAAKGKLLLYFCFYFVKLMIHIVLEPPATIKTVKMLSCLVPKALAFWHNSEAFLKNMQPVEISISP